MPVELNRHTETILCAAVEISDPGQRAAYLDHACGDDAVLRRDVARMVDDHFRAGMFLERPSPALPATYLQPPTERPGTHIGRYKLLEQIGEGGMGVVYVAEQTEPVRRRVALKIIKPGMDTRQVIARFEAERQALAMMDHPNIARVHDGGTTDDSSGSRQTSGTLASSATGRPYFVMELVRGMPITDYCDQARLNPRGRLELFMTVCHAVQHAHQKGIIHRDIKPTNVLVTMQDGQPVVKVIDFGVAKAVNQSLTERTVYTAFTELIGTPLYMSPEQAELTSLDVDTRSDVYSLGVLLYELLTGQTPFDRDTLVKAGLDEIRRMIREDEPPRPSHRISTLAADAGSTVSQRRGIDQRQLTRALKGELDWIVMKALEKDRNRRYESASAFAADIERHLSNEPVAAGPPSALYRFRKFARRRRGALVTLALVAVSLVAGTGISLWQAVEANRARRRAESNVSRGNEAVETLLTRVEDEELLVGQDFENLRHALFTDAIRINKSFLAENPDDPEAQFEAAKAYRRLGQFHERLRDSPRSAEASWEAVRILEPLLETFPNDRRVRHEWVQTYDAFFLAMSHWQLIGRDEADQWWLRRLAPVAKHRYRNEEIRRFRAQAAELLDPKSTGTAHWEQTLKHRLALLGPDHPNTFHASAILANKYFAVNRTEDGIELLAQLHAADPQDTRLLIKLAALQAWFGMEAEWAATCLLAIAHAEDTKDAATAERTAKACSLWPSSNPVLLEPALAFARRAVALDRPRQATEWHLMTLGMAEYRSGNYEASERVCVAALGSRPDPRVAGTSAFYRAMSLFRLGERAKARQIAADAAANMIPPMPADESNPLAHDGAERDVLILWLAYMEARDLIGLETQSDDERLIPSDDADELPSAR